MIINLPCPLAFAANELESHLNEFSKYTVTHHDNIDDTEDKHSHVHKHSEDGEEHGHDHSHKSFSDITSKTLFANNLPSLVVTEVELSLSAARSNLFSNHHPPCLFRPPIEMTL